MNWILCVRECYGYRMQFVLSHATHMFVIEAVAEGINKNDEQPKTMKPIEF